MLSHPFLCGKIQAQQQSNVTVSTRPYNHRGSRTCNPNRIPGSPVLRLPPLLPHKPWSLINNSTNNMSNKTHLTDDRLHLAHSKIKQHSTTHTRHSQVSGGVEKWGILTGKKGRGHQLDSIDRAMISAMFASIRACTKSIFRGLQSNTHLQARTLPSYMPTPSCCDLVSFCPTWPKAVVHDNVSQIFSKPSRS